MRIAQVAPLWERVPPPAYGGTELVVGLLTEELVRRGHDVTLFASGDSVTKARLESVHPVALRLDHTVREGSIYEMLQLSRVYEHATEFDIIHSHMGCAALPYASLVKTPTVHTLHGIFTPDNEKLFKYARRQPYISISQAQRDTRIGLNYVGTVYNGIDPSTYVFHPQPNPQPYLAFLGRISPEKGVQHAITIAKQSGWTLKIAGKVDPVDRNFFEAEIRPLIDNRQIQYLGEANHAQKSEIMGGATVTLFPVDWQEPFGLVMIESMVVGTPVIAIAKGSTPEVIAHGKTGFLCNTINECVAAIEPATRLDRQACHDYVLSRFTVTQMADGYEAIYRQILAERFSQNGSGRILADISKVA
jgi:glycosyltransferase involved in cell wall biosynthesis